MGAAVVEEGVEALSRPFVCLQNALADLSS